MISSTTTVIDFLATIPPFDRMEGNAIERLAEKLEPLRYRMGQAILTRETLPARVNILVQGKARLLAYAPGVDAPETLELLEPGAIFGAAGIVRGVACETAIASTESFCLTLNASDFLALLEQEPVLASAFRNQCSLIEIYDLLGAELERRGKSADDLKEKAIAAQKNATVLNLASGKTALSQLDPNLLWLVSSSGSNYAVGSRLNPTDPQEYIQAKGKSRIRLVGFIDPTLPIAPSPTQTLSSSSSEWDDAPYAPIIPEVASVKETKSTRKYPCVHARGPIDSTLACFQMLSQYWGMPWKRDVLRRTLVNNYQRTGGVSIQLCGVVAELMGLKSQLVNVAAISISKLPTPVLIPWLSSFAILYKASEQELVIAIPEQGITRKKTADFVEAWGEEGQVLILQPTKETPKKRFGLSWFLPAIKKHRTVLIEVFIASLFVQLLGLANPLITQVIIDKVIVQNGINTLNVLGSLLIVMAVIEGVITWLRTNLFVDTTNRIDLSLGSEVIDHLLRLPLRYFEKRPVGEISSRINELENIRSFLTGTALTVVLDAVFSVIYIAVMVFYSWLLTIVALATVPLFAFLTLVFAPIIRSQSRTKAERNAETQSYLVEVVSGIQTVKAQNIELNSRWQWQTRYGRYISGSFENVLTFNTASSLS
ncbi:MAG: cyclic nucleotide-binding domain-containing protein, partial [Tolypothrix sp. T3-bin4]|nr:cyclic nucleotide-binding domain-containing protein [Tolypothrix sp. T3-bin4]